jgi:hypothetical protein
MNNWIKIEKKFNKKINKFLLDDAVNKASANINLENKKKILCNYYIKNEPCVYGPRCLYAHSIIEQKIDTVRKTAYDIIQNEFDLSYLDFNKNSELLKNILIFTKVCSECVNHRCTGGVNCKFGVYTKTLQICNIDVLYGNCNYNNCRKIHLTKRGFKPIYKNKNKNKKNNYNYNFITPIEINNNFFESEYYKNLIEKKFE